MVEEIVAAMERIEADDGIAVVVTQGAAGVLRRRQPRQSGRGRRGRPAHHLRASTCGWPAARCPPWRR
jgi:hypothetical protein